MSKQIVLKKVKKSVNFLKLGFSAFLTMRSRSRSRERKHSRHRSRSRSPQGSRRKEKNRNYEVKKEHHRHRHHDDHEGEHHRTKVKSEPFEDNRKSFGAAGKVENEEEIKEPEKPSFELSGALMQDTNVFNGVVIKYDILFFQISVLDFFLVKKFVKLK